MLKARIVLTGLAITALLGFASCSDSSSPSDNNNNNNNNNPAKNYIPLAKGNSWVYDDVDLDTLTGNPIESSLSEVTDSIVLVSTVAGRADASTLKSYRLGVETDEMVIAKTNTTFDTYLATPFLDEFLEDTKSTWRTMVDFSKSSWTVLDTNLANITFIDTEVETGFGKLPLTVKATGTLKTTGTKGGTATLTIDGKNVTAQEYIIETKVNATLSPSIALITFEPLSVTQTMRMWFAEDIGLVKSHEDPLKVEVKYSGAVTGKQVQNFLGKQRTLKRYKVSK